MPVFITILILLSVPVLVYLKKYKVLLVYCLLSFYTDFFFISFGDFSFWASGYITLWVILIERKILIFGKDYLGKCLWIEWGVLFLVGYYFVIFAPWDDPYQNYRTITQQLPLRTTVGLIRFLEVIFSYYLFVYLFKYYLKVEDLLRTIAGLVVFTFLFGCVDYLLLKGIVRNVLIPGHYALDRFTGLSGEPRSIAQLYGISIFVFLTIGLPLVKFRSSSLLGIVLCIVGIGLSFSATGIGYTSIAILIYGLFGKLKLKQAVATLGIYIIGGLILLNLPQFVEHQTQRVQQVGLEETMTQIPGVPDFINRLEVFDKTTLAFLYFNPQYLLLGVGPNTINIPSGKYLSPVDENIYGGQINTQPNTFLVNVISRSGLLGLIIIFSGIFSLYLAAKRKDEKNISNFVFLVSIYLIFYYSPLIFMLYGTAGSLIKKAKDE